MIMDRKIYIDLLRIIATFLVIAVHVSGFGLKYTEINTFNWQCLNFYYSITSCGVPLFVMISGIFFLNPSKNISIKKIYSKYILRIVIAFIFWSAFYAFGNNIHFIINKDLSGFLYSFFKAFIVGHFHLWFLYMMIGIYIIVPFLKVIAKSKELCEYFILLSFLFVSIIPFIQKIPFLNFTIAVTDKMNLNFVLGFVGYYIAGYYFTTYEIKKKIKIIIYIMAIISWLLSIFATSYISIINNKHDMELYSNLNANTILVSIALFIFFKDHFRKLNFTQKQSQLIINISKYTFGIYLIHVFYVSILFALGMNVAVFNTLLSVFVISSIVFIVSYITIFFIDKIPYLRKYII